MEKILAVCLLFLSVLSVVSGLFFHIGETERKCFIEEIPDETMVVGKFVLCYDGIIRPCPSPWAQYQKCKKNIKIVLRLWA